MKKHHGSQVIMVVAGMLCASHLAAQEENATGPMSGVGGNLRETEARALAPAPTQSGETPALAAPSVDEIPAEPDPGPFWEIQNPSITGDEDFTFEKLLSGKQSIASRMQDFFESDPPAKSRRMIEAELNRIRKELIAQGYYLVVLSMPDDPYDPETKTLRINVDPGYFGNVTVAFPDDREEGRWFSRAQVERRFEKFNEGDTFNYRRLYSTLADVNSHPDLTLDTNIRVRVPENAEGRVSRYADLALTAREKFPLHAMLEINNYSDDSINNWMSQLTIQYLNLTKADDVLTFNPGYSLDGSLLTAAASYMRPNHLGNGGATTVYGGWSRLESKDIVQYLDLYGNGWFAGLVQSYKLVDNESRLLTASAGILYRRISDRFDVTITDEKLQERSVGVVPLTLSLSYSDRTHDFLNGRNFATLSGIYNLTSTGKNELDDFWVDAKEHYAIARLQYARLQPLNFHGTRDNPAHQWTLFMKAEGQLTSDPLIPSEKLFLGGYTTARGFRTKGYLGDNGVYGSLELRTPILLDMVSSMFGSASATPVDRLQFLVFLDAGHTEALKPLPGVRVKSDLVSAGVGARLAVTKHSQFRFDVGFPLNKQDDDDKSARFYFGGQLQF